MLYFDFFALNLFGEGGDGGAGAAPGEAAAGADAGAQTGVTTPDAVERKQGRRTKAERLADVQQKLAQERQPKAAQQAQPTAPEDPEDFDALIKGKYKDAFGAKVQDIISKRFPANKANEDRLNALAPMMELLADKYGIERSEDGTLDEAAIIQAVREDDDMISQQAAERGLSNETYRHVLELENYKKQKEAEETLRQAQSAEYQQYLKVVDQAEKAKQFYPSLDLNQEMANPAFARLIGVGVDAKTAYEVIHKDEIIGGSMRYAAQTAAQKVANSVQANGRRPSENGLGSAATGVGQVSGPLSKDYRNDIKRRALRGEKVVL